MPIPPLIIPPHLLLPPPVVAASATVARAATSSLIASALARHLWKSIPEWIREDESWLALNNKSNGESGEGGDDGGEDFVDEMASLTAVIRKLEGLVGTGYDRLGSKRRMIRRRHVVRRCWNYYDKDGNSVGSSVGSSMLDGEEIISPLEWHAALLAYLQLSNQIRVR